MSRDGLNRTEALKRISSQMPQDVKKRYADFLIDSSTGFESARRQTEEVFALLRHEAEKRSAPDDHTT
jgi:dephospho-CoA kinase